MSCLRSAAKILQGHDRDGSEADHTVLDMERELETRILGDNKNETDFRHSDCAPGTLCHRKAVRMAVEAFFRPGAVPDD